MNGGWDEPRWLVGAGVVLLAGGYAALGADPATARSLAGAGRVAFYGGLVLLVAGVVTWLRRPPRPDPADYPEDRQGVGDDGETDGDW
jgi:hypothetical protein